LAANCARGSRGGEVLTSKGAEGVDCALPSARVTGRRRCNKGAGVTELVTSSQHRQAARRGAAGAAVSVRCQRHLSLSLRGGQAAQVRVEATRHTRA
jgi:hypothetical protein